MKDIKEQINELRNEFNRRIDELEKELKPEFKIPAWYKFHNNEINETVIFRAVTQDTNWLHLEYPEDYVKGYHKRFCTPATPQEIESHLRSICDPKYVGKKVKSAYDSNNEFYCNPKSRMIYSIEDDALYIDCNALYFKGKFAEILPSLKPKPETMRDFQKFISDAWDYKSNLSSTNCFIDFLDQYNIK